MLAVPASVVFEFCHSSLGRTGVVTGGLGLVLAGAYILTRHRLIVIVVHYVLDAIELLGHEWLDNRVGSA